jgi:predicted nucleic acid-binding protein
VPSYLDASAIVSMLVAEARTPAVFSFLASTTDDLIVSELTAAEVASAISRMVRRQDLSSADAVGRLARFDAWRSATTIDAAIEDVDLRWASLLVRRFELKLRAPDAIHLAASLRLGTTLVTGDGTLANAARDNGGPVLEL